MAAAASLSAEAAAWRKHNFSVSSSAFGSAVAAWRGGGNNAALAAAAWRMLTIFAIVTIMKMIDY